MSSNGKRSNLQAAQHRQHVFEVWKAQGSVESLQDEWLDDDTWVETLTTNCSRMLPKGLVLTSRLLNEVVSKGPTLKDAVDLDQNDVGLYRHVYSDGKRRVKTYQWRKAGMKKFDPLPKSKRWSERLHDPFWSERAAREPAKKRARTEPAAEDEDDDKDDASDDCDDGRSSSPSDTAGESRPAIDPNAEVVPTDICASDSDSDSDYSDDDSDDDFDLDGEEVDLFGVKELPDGTSVYYVSPEAKILFSARMEETAYDAIVDQIEICSAVHNNWAPYDSVVVDGGEGKLMSDFAIHKVRMQCHYIAKALQLRLDNASNELDWRSCCKQAVAAMKMNGTIMANNADTVMGWYRSFREERKFPNPSRGKSALPPFLQVNPEAAMFIQAYAKENLKDLDSKLILEYLHDTLIPKFMKDEKATDKKRFLKKYGLTKLCPRTVLNWLHALGFRYEEHRKNFYVDNHEDPATVRYRWKFVARYLLVEKRAHRWIQITKSEMLSLSKEYPVLLKVGYEHTDKESNEEMVEYHVDTIPLFQERMENVKFGGNLSVRIEPGVRPLIIIGQDEAIFKQYLFRMKRWQIGKTRAAMPKDDGAGVMISGFQSREFGFGLEMSVDDLRRVNEAREGQNYTDELAAKAINKGSAAKPKLDHSPFVELFHYGASAEGYWTYDRMVLQVEDVVDCLKVLYPEYDFIFMFDHSCGHDRSQENGLNARRMSAGFGGKQQKMHPTIIREEDGYLGDYPRALEPGDVQEMVWPEFENDEDYDGTTGPYWMTPEERKANRKTVYGEVQHGVDKTVNELIRQLFVEKNVRVKGVKEKVQAEATKYGVSLTKDVRTVLVKGWQGQPKGLIQVLWERGFIDPSKPRRYYAMKGTKDSTNIIRPDSCLVKLMEACTDFEEEQTLLQKMVQNMSDRPGQFSLDRSPKCHCELAGEGIEYAWGCAKNWYRNQPMSEKKGKKNFLALVRRSISRDQLTTVRIRKFSRRARQYICSYRAMQCENNNNDNLAIDPDMLPRVEKVLKEFRAHRCALDFDHKFCKAIQDEDNNN